MLAKITNVRFGGIKSAATADETGLAEGGSFRLVSMTLPFHRGRLYESPASRGSRGLPKTGCATFRRAWRT
jgi:hypothetical protein